jgi:replicative DNA helicase
MEAQSSGENRATEISEISAMKSLAKELKVPVMALSQLNRALEQRPKQAAGDVGFAGMCHRRYLVLCADGSRFRFAVVGPARGSRVEWSDGS